MDAPNRLPDVVIGRSRYGAGIQNYQVSRGPRFHWTQTIGGQTGMQRRAVGLRGTATEILNVECLRQSLIIP